MYCRYCGAEVDEDSVFCASCGKQVEEPSGASDTVAQDGEAVPEAKKSSPTHKRKRKQFLILVAILAVIIAMALMVFPMVQKAVDPCSVAFAEVSRRVELDHVDGSDAPLPSLTQYGREVTSLRKSPFSLKDKGRGSKYICKGASVVGAVQLKGNTMTIIVKQGRKSSERYFNQLVAAAIVACNSDVTENTAIRDAKDIIKYGFNGSYVYGMQSYHVLSVNDDGGVGEDYFACLIES